MRVSPFAVGATKVTNRQYDALVKGHKRPAESKGDAMPVTGITYAEAARYAALLSKREGRRYRLPTDAEWEYAARGGLEGKDYPWGDDASTIPAHSGIHGLQKGAKPVGSYPPNAYGLYDMVGNASEWVFGTGLDFPPGVADAVEVAPVHLGEKDGLLLRGGSFLTWYPFVWSVSPGVESLTAYELPDVGFRLVREAKR